MSLFGVSRRRATIIIGFGVGIVVVTWLLHQRHPEIISESVVGGVVLAFISGIVLGGIRDWAKAGQPDPPQFFTHASDRLGRPKHILGYQYGDVDASQAQFFRTPPSWTDIEEEYVVEHPKLQSILEDVETHRGGLILIEGPPASGKSCLLFSIGYELLANTRFRTQPVYILELKTNRRNLNHIHSDLDRLPKNTILLVDDVHLKPRTLIEFAKEAQNTNVTLVYATRPTRNFSRDLDRALEDLRQANHPLEASDIAADIIDRFISTLDLQPAENDRVVEQCLKYQDDLYALEAALRTYREEGDVSDEHINRWIADKMLGSDDYGDVFVDRGRFLIAIACLYRFEVPVTRDYLISYLELPEAGLRALVRAGEVLTTTGNKYGLHHSSVAQLIIDAAQGVAKHNIPPQIRENESELDWPAVAVRSYIDEEPHLAINILAEIANTQAEGRRLGKTLLNQLDSSVLAFGIDPNHTSMDNLGSFFYLYLGHEADPSAAVIEALEEFAEECEETNPAAWVWTANVLARLDVPAASTFGDRLAPLLAGAAPELIADSLTSISYGDLELAMDIADCIDPEEVADRLETQNLSPAKVAMIIAKLVWVDPDRFNLVATRFATLLLNVDPDEFPVVLCRVAWGNQSSAKRMLTTLTKVEISRYLETITDPTLYYHALAAIYLVAPTFAQSLSVESPSASSEDELYVQASQRLLTVEAATPVKGLHDHVSGHAYNDNPSAAGITSDLLDCVSLSESERDNRLKSIADAAPPSECLLGLIALPEKAVSEIGANRLAAWLTGDVDTTALPAEVVDTALVLLGENKDSLGETS